MTEPSEILSRIGLWSAALHQRGLIDEATAAKLNETLAASHGERLDSKNDPLLVVMLCGPTAVGKSSLINALAGADISRQGLGATTDAPVLYVHERDDPTRLFEYGNALGRDAQEQTTLFRHHRDELLHKVLVDTPDIDSVMLQHEAMTAGLVHAADLVVFVTSPEKYKVLRSARWVLEQRQQRAFAFVLNKWDRQALGLQRDRRDEIETDFRDVLTAVGYPEALIFKVSALHQPERSAGHQELENELPALREWLDTGLDQSSAAIIQQRRLRAAWGRLAFAITAAKPRPLSGHPFLPVLIEGLTTCGANAATSINAEASVLAPLGLGQSEWPATPGLLGMWARLREHLAVTTASLRAGLSRYNFVSRPASPAEGLRSNPVGGDAFGGTTCAMLSDAELDLVAEAAAARLPLGPVAAAWTAETTRLQRELARLPLDAATSLTTKTARASLRRWAGTASIYALEGAIGIVLSVTVVRLGMAFLTASDAPKDLLLTAFQLIFALLIIGHIAATSFFPPLRQRLRRQVAKQASMRIRTGLARLQADLREQIEAGDGLAAQGDALLGLIDHVIGTLTAEPRDDEGVNRLFGIPAHQLIPAESKQLQPVPAMAKVETTDPRRPLFD